MSPRPAVPPHPPGSGAEKDPETAAAAGQAATGAAGQTPDPASDSTEGWCSAFGRFGDGLGSCTVGFLTGFLGAMGGVGGGPFCVPLLGAFLGLSQKKCIGTSILCGLTTLVVGGATTFLGTKRIDIPMVPIAVIALVAPCFGYISARMTNRMSQKTLRLIFAWFLLFCSLQILYKLVYSPTGVEGHWEYDLVQKQPAKGDRRGLVYEIERVEDELIFRTQHFHALLEPAQSGRQRGKDAGGQNPPQGFEDGWCAPLINVRNNQQRGTIWVRVVDRGNILETVFHSKVPKPHWNNRITAHRKKATITRIMTDLVNDSIGSFIFHVFLAVIAGMASGLLGIAGGSVVVPLMSLTGAFPWSSITATSMLSMIPTSATTCYTHHRAGNVVLHLAPGLILGTVSGAFAGAKLMTVTTEVVRKSACAGVLLFTASIMMFQGVVGSFVGRERPQLLTLSGGTIVFFCVAALLQEKVFNLPEFSHDALLTFLQSSVVGSLAFFDLRRERKIAENTGRPDRRSILEPKCPIPVYMAVAVLGSTSLLLTNRASKLLDYTTQVVFKSSKLPWIMVFRALSLTSKRLPSVSEWVWAFVLSSGLAVFTFAGASIREHLTNEFWLGLVSILGALSCDAAMYCVEEGVVFGRFKADKHELIFYMQAFSIPTTFLFLLMSHSLPESIGYVQAEWRFPTLIVGAAACTYMGTRCLMQIIQEYDSNIAVTTTLLRKVCTVLLSYALFPKHFAILHVVGVLMVFLGAHALFRASTKRHDADMRNDEAAMGGIASPRDYEQQQMQEVPNTAPIVLPGDIPTLHHTDVVRKQSTQWGEQNTASR
eukprot:Hpha_TRINITY_DN6130_c0_g1::TRINITY_DN6130_c0_g1_i1::g.164861::m.164861